MTDGNPAAIDLLKKPAERLAFLCCGRQAPGGPGLKPPSYQRRFKPCDAGIKPEAGVLHKERFEGVIGKTRGPEVGPYQIGALRRDQTDGVSAEVSRRAVFTRASTARQTLFGFCLLS